MSSPIDPVVLLNVLEPILDKSTGGVREVHLANRLVNIMRDARKLVQRCIYLNIIEATQSEDIRKQIITLGGWDILYEWLKEGEQFEHWAVAKDILQLFINLPVSIELLRSNAAPKVVRRLSKRQDIQPGVRNLAVDVLSIWKDIVIDDHLGSKEKSKQESDSTSLANPAPVMADPNIDLESSDEPYAPASSSLTTKPAPTSSREGKSAQNVNTHLKVRKTPAALVNNIPQYRPPENQQLMKLGKSGMSDKTEKLNRKDIEQILKQPTQQRMDERLKKSNQNTIGSKRINETGSMDIFGAALSVADQATAKATDETNKRRKTVKTFRTTFRSTGLDQDPEPVSSNVKKRKAIPELLDGIKRKGSVDGGGELTEKTVNRPGLKTGGEKMTSGTIRSGWIDGTSGEQQEQPVQSPTTTTPPNTKPVKTPISSKAIQMRESDSFMAALTVSSTQPRQAAVIRRKKVSTDSNSGGGISKPSEPNQISAPKPQFYKDIISTTTDTGTTTTASNWTQQIPVDIVASTGGVLEESEQGKQGKRRVRWAKESELVRIQYFELDESERSEKSLALKNNSNLASVDKKMEREALEAARRGLQNRGDLASADGETYSTWKLIPLENPIELVTQGAASEEKKIQQERMKNVLAEIYFSYDMIPDTPKEADFLMGQQDAAPPLIIPLEDVSHEIPHAVGPPGVGLLPTPALVAGPQSGSASLPPELAQLLQNLNKSGMIPQGQAPTVGAPGFGNVGTGFGPPVQPPATGFTGGMVQQGSLGPTGMPPAIGQVPMQQTGGNVTGIPPAVSGLPHPTSTFPNQPSFGPHSAGHLGPPPSAGTWNSQLAPNANTGGFSSHGGFQSRGGGARGGPGGPGGARFDKLCPFHLRGRCTFGDHCRFKHGDPPRNSPPAGGGRDRDRGARQGGNRRRFRSPPGAGRHRQHQRRFDRNGSPERERDQDYRQRHSPQHRPLSPTYSAPTQQRQLSPPAQIMDDSPAEPSFNLVNSQQVPVVLSDTPASP